MDSDIKILKFLLDNKEQRFTIRQIAESTKINYRIAHHRIVDILEKEGLIKIKKAGNSKLCEFTNKFSSKVYEAEYIRKYELEKKRKDFAVIRDRFAELHFAFIALLFGSYAKGTADRHSDIDILTIGGDETEIRKAISLLPDKIHLTCISYEDFIRMAKSKEFTVVSEAIKNNIILLGREEYYRLLRNAGYEKN